mgnify:CR=1 FL=1|tara:strand:- start:4726 stop:5085 length:360 start_codon:yes stop_codon:yes gene_type:complete
MHHTLNTEIHPIDIVEVKRLEMGFTFGLSDCEEQKHVFVIYHEFGQGGTPQIVDITDEDGECRFGTADEHCSWGEVLHEAVSSCVPVHPEKESFDITDDHFDKVIEAMEKKLKDMGFEI